MSEMELGNAAGSGTCKPEGIVMYMLLYLVFHFIMLTFVVHPIIYRRERAIEVRRRAELRELILDYKLKYADKNPAANPAAEGPVRNPRLPFYCRMIKLLTFAKAAANCGQAAREVVPMRAPRKK
ncbi:uncharacterized protein N7483_009738 [Penicillium malachiteum]|uniref:uncharacterized protein n=1 Tax=Penicillium malachiteum TaxID=1324776 RepID=UPI002546A2FB|nr:uncharacterized protein N7483_009738 [Penicillium malachiteum]KAJ5721804.1 hypothetical protein N7483_009738 [Penicillium malachiteum]